MIISLDAAPLPPLRGDASVEYVHETMNYLTPKGEVELNVEIPYEYAHLVASEPLVRRVSVLAQRRFMPIISASPWEIAGIREQFGMTQKAFAELLGVGHASIERWETGENMQSQSMDNLILLLSDPANKGWLDRQRIRRERLTLARQNVVPLDRFRVLSESESTSLKVRSQTFRSDAEQRAHEHVCHNVLLL